MLDFCQVCRHYDIGVNQCSKAPKRAIPKSKCADYEYHTHEDLCKYCSHNDYGRCTVLGNKCSVEPLLMNICADFENKANMNKRMEYEKKEEVPRIEMQKNIQAIHKRSDEFMRLCKDWLAHSAHNQCKADGGMDYCDKFIDKEESERIENAKKIAAIRKRCEEFMQGLVYDFGDIIVADTAEISETERKKIDWNKEKQIPYTDKSPFIDFSLKFTVYNKD